ncbi:MAG: hypothetical protein ABIH03_10755, partial [Pseudomonadota bacterium]
LTKDREPDAIVVIISPAKGHGQSVIFALPGWRGDMLKKRDAACQSDTTIGFVDMLSFSQPTCRLEESDLQSG